MVVDFGGANRAKVPTLEEAERMAALLIDEEEKAKQTVLLKVYSQPLSLPFTFPN